MDIQLHNTLGNKKEIFKPITKGHVSMYQCGPTVYDTAHIGNLRTYVFNDILRRVLEFNGYKVTQVMNITDVDDKTIKKSRDEHASLEEVTSRYEKLFFEDLEKLHILTPTQVPHARAYIPAMIAMIETLLEKGFAYKAEDGIYFSINKSKNYGELAQLKLSSELRERISNDEYDKESARDFVLWKFHTDNDRDVAWDAPFGKGRPGWHIECSAMAMKELGETIDIHTAAIDLIFPHHTNEIAQLEAITNKPFVHYWLHGAFMNVNESKMAKSKGNFLKLDDLLHEHISPLAYRYWLLGAHYRTELNFTFEALKAAQTALMRLIKHFIEFGATTGVANESYRSRFHTFINDDLDVPQGLALAWELIKDKEIKDEDKRATLLEFDRVFGLNLADIDVAAASHQEPIPAEVTALAEAREEARKNKDWTKADALRKEIEERGYEVKDTEEGVKIVAR